MGTTRGTLADNKPYKRRDLDGLDCDATITVTGDAINIYHSIKADSSSQDPANIGEMQADDANPISAGVYPVKQFDFIAIVSTGTSVVQSRNLIS